MKGLLAMDLLKSTSRFSSWKVYCVVFVAILTNLEGLSAFKASIDLAPSQKRCIGEQLSKHVLVMGEFRVTHPHSAVPTGAGAVPMISVTATDPVNKTPVFHQSSKDHVRTAFTSTKPGIHMFCVRNISKIPITTEVELLWGPGARDYSQLAKAEHLDDVMVQLLQIQDKLKLYHNNILYMSERGEEVRQDNSWIAWWLICFCIINILLLILTSLLSGYFFKRFFRSKKII